MTFSTAIFSHASMLFTSQLAFTDDIAEVRAIVLDSLLNTLAISTALVIFLMLQHSNIFNGGAQAHTSCWCVLIVTRLNYEPGYLDELLRCTNRFKIYVPDAGNLGQGTAPKPRFITIDLFPAMHAFGSSIVIFFLGAKIRRSFCPPPAPFPSLASLMHITTSLSLFCERISLLLCSFPTVVGLCWTKLLLLFHNCSSCLLCNR